METREQDDECNQLIDQEEIKEIIHRKVSTIYEKIAQIRGNKYQALKRDS